MKIFICSALLLLTAYLPYAMAENDPVDWGVCSVELKDNCGEKVYGAKAVNDSSAKIANVADADKHKHDCLGKVDRAKFSKDCLDHFKGLCKQFGKNCGRHRHKHKNKKHD